MHDRIPPPASLPRPHAGRGGRALLLWLAGGLACLLPAMETELAALRERQRAVARRLVEAYVFIGGGSGVIVDPDGLMVTNHHVAGERPGWQVMLSDGKRYPARLLGVDPVGDLAVLRIAADEPLPHVPLGDAADLKPGTPVLAIGNPFGLGGRDHRPTVTMGTLGTGRLVRGHYADCVQFDAPVNPGNSGGPTLNLAGELLGINGQIRTRSGLRINSGIGLAIACTQLAEFIPRLRDAEGGFVHHAGPPAGLEWEQRPRGVFLTEVPPSCPELRVDDRLMEINGRSVTAAAVVAGLFAARAWRTDLRHPVRIEREGREIESALPTGRTPIPGRPWLGIKLTARGGKALIHRVAPGSPAAAAGLEAGLEVVMVNGQAVGGTIDLLKAMVGREIGDAVTVTVVTAGSERRTFEFRLTRRP